MGVVLLCRGYGAVRYCVSQQTLDCVLAILWYGATRFPAVRRPALGGARPAMPGWRVGFAQTYTF